MTEQTSRTPKDAGVSTTQGPLNGTSAWQTCKTRDSGDVCSPRQPEASVKKATSVYKAVPMWTGGNKGGNAPEAKHTSSSGPSDRTSERMLLRSNAVVEKGSISNA